MPPPLGYAAGYNRLGTDRNEVTNGQHCTYVRNSGNRTLFVTGVLKRRINQ